MPQEEIVNTYLEDLEFYHRLTETKTVTSIFSAAVRPHCLNRGLSKNNQPHLPALADCR